MTPAPTRRTFTAIAGALILVAIFLGCTASVSAQSVVGPNDISYRERSMAADRFDFRGSFVSGALFNFDRPWFSVGPSWLMNAMPGSHVSYLRSPSIYDRDGDRTDSVYHPADIGTLANPFNLMLFSNVSSFVFTSGTTPKTNPPIIVDSGGGGTPATYFLSSGGNWDGSAAWGSLTSLNNLTPYPNGQGDIAQDLQEVNGAVTQNIAGGVTVGTIDHHPTSPGNSSGAVSWTITTANPIILDNAAAPALITISQASDTTTQVTGNSLTINGTGGLSLVSNLQITNVDARGLITISAPISGTGSQSVTVAGPGTTILSGANTYTGGTTVNSGTLLINNTSGSGTGSGAVTVNGGTLGGTGTIIAGNNSVSIGTGATITGGANGTVGSLTLQTTSLNFASGSIFHVDITGSSTDLLTLSGLFNITSGAAIEFNASSLSESRYVLATYGSWDNVQFTGAAPSGYALEYLDGELDLVAVPEPATWIGGALALAALGFAWRSRKAEKLKR
jgi:autotransporter-associated beta strand protein